MLCKRVQLSSQRSWPKTDGVILHGGNPLTQFSVSVSVCRHMVLHSNDRHVLCAPEILYITVHFQNCREVSSKCRDSRVEELWGLTSFFGYSTQTFVHAVNLLDRFLTAMKVNVLERIQIYCVVLITVFSSTYFITAFNTLLSII